MRRPTQKSGLHIFVSLVVLALCLNSGADVPLPQYSSRTWRIEHGLPHQSLYALMETRDGHLWIGTPKGLMQFNGIRFKPFGDSRFPQLAEAPIKVLLQTKNGDLFIGSESSGLLRLHEGSFELCQWVLDRRIKALFETSDGTLWVGTMGGLGRYKNGEHKWFTTTNGLPDDIVLAFCEDRPGNLWIGTNRGLVRFREGFHEVYNRDYRLSSNSIRALLCDREGNLWIATNGGGLMRLRNDEFVHFGKEQGLPDDFVWTMCEDSRGQLWVGTYGGLCRRSGDQFIAESNTEGLSYEMVFTIIEDHEHILWIGTKEGLSQLSPRLFTCYNRANGLSHNNATAVYEDKQGRILVSTWGGGLNVLENGKVSVYGRNQGLGYEVLLGLHQGADGAIWLGTDYDGGLYRFQDGTFAHFGKDDGIVESAARIVYEDRQRTLWIGTSGGLYRRQQDGKFQRFGRADGLPDGVIRAVCEDAEGNVWFGTHGGLVKRAGDKFVSFTIKDGLSANQVLALHEDKERTLWIGTGGGGLNRFKAGRFTAFTTKQGLHNNTILHILEDDVGNLWMSSFDGVFRVRKAELENPGTNRTLNCIAYGKADGMASAQCNGIAKPGGCKSRDGRLWFPTTRGVAVVDPKDTASGQIPPPVEIEEVIVDGVAVQSSQFEVQRLESQPKGSSLTVETRTLNLPPGRGELQFQFAALSLRVPEKNRFKYRLEGEDADWVDAGHRSEAFYNNLRPGRYVFRVIGCGSDGIWNNNGAALTIRLLPHFWQTWWFASTIAIAMLGSAAGTARFITRRRMQIRLLALEKEHAVEKERNRIAQDMHDDLGARLTEILLVTEQALQSKADPQKAGPRIERIANAVREVVDSMDALVWAVNPGNDSIDKLAIYINEFAPAFLDKAGIACRFDVPQNLPDLPLSSEVRHNLFLVIKECLNNIAKHAQCTEVWIRMRAEEGMLTLGIDDNGRGFSVSEVSALGNGLINMEKRMKRIAGTFSVTSTKGRGTQVKLELALGRTNRRAQ